MLKRIINKVIRILGLKVQLLDIKEINFYSSIQNSSLLYTQLDQDSKELIAPLMPFSRSEYAQDLFAIVFANNSKSKYFVEFGATDGFTSSNTWLLEKKLGWEGILAEPAKIFHNALYENRSCNIEEKCIANKGGEIYQFLECENGVLSSLENYAENGDWAQKIRKEKLSRKYKVESLSLEELLNKYKAPYEIQFLSLDTEGSELDILRGFNFKKYKINSICVEHNRVKKTRKKIYKLLTEKGYKRVFENISKVDDWYLLKN